MIRPFLNNFYCADHHLGGRTITAVGPTKHEAWAALIELVAIEARNQ